ncbi:MAG TPA: hypothetical protein VED40_14430 [Azospirillaceae bacterium]|nr:hypothetical protein [Azospirillaceae bacterium]
MTELSMTRLYALRAAYLILGGGLALTIWPRLLDQPADWPVMGSVVAAMLGGLSLMALLGLRYPLRMLPILLFEFAWKAIWLGLVALPRWLDGSLDDRMMATVADCAVIAILMPLIPWRHVVATYVRAPGTPWRTAGTAKPA